MSGWILNMSFVYYYYYIIKNKTRQKCREELIVVSHIEHLYIELKKNK